VNKISLCNEVISGREDATNSFDAQCTLAADLGYDGLEVAPFTLCKQPEDLSAQDRKKILQTSKSRGIEITSLHWLLVSPVGLSITTLDSEIWENTLGVIKATIDLCSDLEGSVLVHGSPKQRIIPSDKSAYEAKQRALDIWYSAGSYAQERGVTYCIEPLARNETSFINTLEEAMSIVNTINSPGLKTMIDTSAAGLAEAEPVADLIRKWAPSGNVAHVQLNSTNRGAPGDGDDPFNDIFTALKEVHYDGVFAIEPFIYKDGGRATAKRAINYVKGILEDIGHP
jgi:sugar phosphate isomerase/epimerase